MYPFGDLGIQTTIQSLKIFFSVRYLTQEEIEALLAQKWWRPFIILTIQSLTKKNDPNEELTESYDQSNNIPLPSTSKGSKNNLRWKIWVSALGLFFNYVLLTIKDTIVV